MAVNRDTVFHCQRLHSMLDLSSESLKIILFSGADLGEAEGAAAPPPPFQFVGDLFFVKIYNNFIIL